MDLKQLAELLGLGEDVTEEQILEAVKACLAENKSLKEGQQPPADDKVVANKTVCELLGLKAGAAVADVNSKIMELKGGIIDGVNCARRTQGPESRKRRTCRRRSGHAGAPIGQADPAAEGLGKELCLE